MKVKGKFAVLVATAVTLLALVVNACAAPAPAPAPYEVDEWVLHVQGPLTGGWAGYGVEGQWAIEHCAQWINDTGGIAGKPLKIIYHNNQSEPVIAQAIMAEMIDTNPLVVSIADGDIQAVAVGPLYVAAEIPCLQPVSGTTVGKLFDPWYIGFLDWNENQQGPAEVAWLEREPDITKVVPLFAVDSPSYIQMGRTSMFYIRDEMGVEIGEPIKYEHMTTTEFGALAIAALAQDDGHTGYWFSSTGAAVAKLIVEFQRRGFTDTRRLFIDACCDYPELYEIGEGYIDGCYLKTYYNVNYEGERWQKAVADWQATHDVQYGAYAITFSYDVPYYFKMAIEGTGVTGDPAKRVEERVILRDWMRNQKQFPFITGPADIVEGIQVQPIYLNTLVNNQKTLLEKIESPFEPGVLWFEDATDTSIHGW